MTQENIAWSITDEIKLIKGLKDNYSFTALSSVTGKDVEEIQRKCIALDLYMPVCENIDDLSQITLVPNPQVCVACLGKTMTGVYRELTDMGWAPQNWRGESSLRSPEWWVARPSLPYRYNDDETTPSRRTAYLLNNGKPWTSEDLGALLAALAQRPNKDVLTQVMMRSMSNIIQQLSIIGLVRVGTDDDSGEAKVWVSPVLSTRQLAKLRYFDVLPLLHNGWLIDGMQLAAPSWWANVTLFTDIVPDSWPIKQNPPTGADAPVHSKEHMSAAASLLKSINAKRERVKNAAPQSVPLANRNQPVPSESQEKASKPQVNSGREKSRNGKMWFSGNYKFLFTLLSEHHSPEVIGKKMDRTPGAVCSRIRHIGLSRYVKGEVHLVDEISIDTLRKQPDFVKEHLIRAGWTEKGNFLIAPTWWQRYPHPLN